MKARIYKPTRTAMQQSGQADGNHWLLEFTPTAPLFVDPLMGWTGMTDTAQQVKLPFTTQEEALAYAKGNGIEVEPREPEARVVKPKSYAINFAFDRVIDTPETRG